ncbi:YqgE/AlgH family protein [Engelhardtia mirabilis]|nr:hypothetical protein Pla86_42560 [Planctomycetes bacterium Pla86]
MEDPNFSQAVLLICQHGPEGAYGLVLNRPLDLTVGKLLPEHELLADSIAPVFLGGPVDHSRLQFVHMVPGRIPGGHEICTGLWLGGDLDALAKVLGEAERGEIPVPAVRLFLGYAGWSPGQLERELSEGSWLPVPLATQFVFQAEGEEAWSSIVDQLEPGTGGPTPSLN